MQSRLITPGDHSWNYGGPRSGSKSDGIEYIVQQTICDDMHPAPSWIVPSQAIGSRTSESEHANHVQNRHQDHCIIRLRDHMVIEHEKNSKREEEKSSTAWMCSD